MITPAILFGGLGFFRLVLVVCGKQNSEYALDCGAANPGCRRLSAGAWSFYIPARVSSGFQSASTKPRLMPRIRAWHSRIPSSAEAYASYQGMALAVPQNAVNPGLEPLAPFALPGT